MTGRAVVAVSPVAVSSALAGTCGGSGARTAVAPPVDEGGEEMRGDDGRCGAAELEAVGGTDAPLGLLPRAGGGTG